MAWKPAFATSLGAEALAPSRPAGLWDPLARLAGEGAVNLLRARAEVQSALQAGNGAIPAAPPLDDALPPSSIPSVAAGAHHDRVLAEIDQDGFAFAVDPIDVPFFNRRNRCVRRQKNLLDIVLFDGRICVRKRFRSLRPGARAWGDRPVPAREWIQRGVWVSLGFYLYTEAAALLRLHDLPFVPKLRGIDVVGKSIFIDFVSGDSLRACAARAGLPIHDSEIADADELSHLTARELERREVSLLDHAGSGGVDFRREIAEMKREINARGVAPLDIKLGNFVRGATTGRLYWIDFEISRLRSQPRWETDLAAQNEILEQLFELDAHGHTVV